MLSRLKLLPFFIAIILLLTGTHPAAAQDDPSPLDIILLLDSSGSTISQRGLIEGATKFLLDYLEANAEFAGLDYRLGIVGFNQGVIDNSAIALGRPSEANLDKFFTDTPAGGDTDFGPVLNYALNEFDRLNSIEDGRTPLVILMTDGQPARQGEPLPESEIGTYFDDLGQTITAIGDTGIQLFVVGIGDAGADQERWQAFFSTEEQYAYIDTSSNLSEIYWQFLSEFLGGEQDAVTQLTADTEHIISIEPYLDELTFTVLKETPEAEVIIEQPSGDLFIQPPAGGVNNIDLHEIYIISRPESGEWKLTIQGNDGRLLVNRRFPKVKLIVENSAIPADTSFQVRATIESESLREADNLSLLLVDGVENYEEASIHLPFESVIDGLLYEVTVSGLTETDVYNLSPLIFVENELLSSVRTEGVSVKIVALPRITGLTVTQETSNGPFVIKYDIENDEGIHNFIPELLIFLNGKPVIEELLKDHDETGENILGDFQFEEKGDYEVVLYIEGATADNLSYSDTFRVAFSIREPVPSTLPLLLTPTVNPAPSSTEVPSPLPTVPSPLQNPPIRWNAFANMLIIIPLSVLALTALMSLALYVKKNRWLLSEKVILQEEGAAAKNTDSHSGDWEDNNISSNNTLDSPTVAELKNLQFHDDPDVARQQSIEQIKKILNEADRMFDKGREYALPILESTLRKVLETISNGDTKNFFNKYFQERINKEEDNHRIELLLSAVAPIFQDMVSEDSKSAVKIVYDHLLITNKVSPQQVARAFDILSKDELFHDWCNAIENRSSDNYVQISENESRYGSLARIYTVLSILDKAGDDCETSAYETQYAQIKEHFAPAEGKPQETWGKLIDELSPIFKHGQRDKKSREAWESFRRVVKSVQKEIGSDRYVYIPETKLIQSYLDNWFTRSDSVISHWINATIDSDTPGQIYLQLKAGLNLYDEPEEKLNIESWTYALQGLLFHVGGAKVTDLQLKYQQDLSVVERIDLNITEISSEQYAAFATNLPRTIRKTQVRFFADYQTSTVYGRTRRTEPVVHEELFSLSVGGDPKEHSVEVALEPKFIIGRELNSDEVLFFNTAYIRRKVEAIHRFLLDQKGLPGVILLEGLRQTGKTTIIKQVLSELNDPVYQVVEIDLMTWWNTKLTEQGLHAEKVFFFWQYFLKLLRQTIPEDHPDLRNDINKLMDDWSLTKCSDLVRDWSERTKNQLVLVLDDADIFRNFKDDEVNLLIDQFMDLLVDTKSVLWLANDDRAETWRAYLKTKFNSYVQKEQAGAKLKSFKTELLSYEESIILLKKSGLKFTDMAFITAYAYTGGWVSCLQALGKALIETVNDTVEAFGKASSLVTAGGIRQAFLENRMDWLAFEGYLENSFSPQEIKLLQVLVEHFIDPKTGVIAKISYAAHYWQGVEKLEELIGNDEDIEDYDFSALLHQLRMKDVIGNISINGMVSPIVTLKIGWLYYYIKDKSRQNISSQIGKR